MKKKVGELNMIEFIKDYSSKNEQAKNFNLGLIKQTDDKDIVYHIMDSFKSLEILEDNIKIVGAYYEDDESKVDINNHIRRRGEKETAEKQRYQYLDDGMYGELTVHIRLTDSEGKSKDIKKSILIPTYDEDGYYNIKGTRYNMLYQLVDKSTYVRGRSLILKSLMAVSVTRIMEQITDTEGKEYNTSSYRFVLFKQPLDIIVFYLAKMGFSKTIAYFGLHGAITLKPEIEDKENKVYFQINSSMFLEADRELFEKHEYIRSICCMFLNTVTNRLLITDVNDCEYWLKKIGNSNGAAKAYSLLDNGKKNIKFFERMLDESSKKTLIVHEKNKTDIYATMRWMVQNYTSLRMKDDMDLANKRVRRNEYVSSLLTKEFSGRISRIISAGGANVEMRILEDLFKFKGDIIIRQLHNSGILRFDDRINDMDMFNKIKYTNKGPNSLGGGNGKTMSVRYRGIHPSYLERIDINVCG